MRIQELHSLTQEGLEKYYRYLEKESARSGMYAQFSELPEGKFLIEELKTRRELARNLYVCIDPNDENSVHVLILLQAYEREADEWLSRLVGDTNRAAELDGQMKAVLNLVEHRKEQADKRMFLPAGYNKEKEAQ